MLHIEHAHLKGDTLEICYFSEDFDFEQSHLEKVPLEVFSDFVLTNGFNRHYPTDKPEVLHYTPIEEYLKGDLKPAAKSFLQNKLKTTDGNC